MKDGIGATVAQVAEDAKAYAAAQVELYKTVARVRIRAGKSGIVFGVLAAVLAIAAFGALLVGLILSLATLIGPLGATGVVVIATLAIAGVLGWLAGKQLSAAFGGAE
ncbi:phage holin family protein [Sphingomonas sp. RS2018]